MHLHKTSCIINLPSTMLILRLEMINYVIRFESVEYFNQRAGHVCLVIEIATSFT